MVLTLTAQDHFDRLGREEEQEFRIPEIRKNSTLELLLKFFDTYTDIMPSFLKDYSLTGSGKDTIKIEYNLTKKFIDLLPRKIRTGDLRDLSILLPNLEKTRSLEQDVRGYVLGLYLAAGINKCSDKEIKIAGDITQQLKLENLGMKNNGKNIIIRGDVDAGLGYRMKKGLIEVHGDVYGGDDETGPRGLGSYLQGGKIKVYGRVLCGVGYGMSGGGILVYGNLEGDTYEKVGAKMTNGKIVIEGNTNDSCFWPELGRGMSGGEIHLKCDKMELHDDNIDYFVHNSSGGSLYYQGKLVAKDCRRIKE